MQKLPNKMGIVTWVLPYRKVSLESFGPTVCIVPTNLTVVVDVQAMELVQPVGDWLEEKRGFKLCREKERNGAKYTRRVQGSTATLSS